MMVLFGLVFFGAVTVSNAFDVAQLQKLVTASSLSYLPLDSIAESPYFKSSVLLPLFQVVDPVTESGATIFAEKEDDTKLVVACRGSATLKNFVTNLKFNMVPAELPLVPTGSKVHGGFQEAASGLWDCLNPRLSELEKEKRRTVVFTGHSLGAATALLCAVQHAAVTPRVASDVVTFGGPRICNAVLARHVTEKALANSNILHLVHDADPVLANNKPLWDSLGFETTGEELQCDPNIPRVYQDIAESSSSTLAWNIIDHCKYLGIFVGPRILVN